MTDHELPKRPWTEDEWLAEFRKSDARSARFGELLETLFDDPDCDAIIAREMGWDRDDEEEDDGIERPWLEDFYEAVGRAQEEASAELAESTDEPPEIPFDSPTNEMPDLLHAEDDDDRAEGLPLLSESPAYRAAVDLAQRVLDWGRRHDEPKFDVVHDEELYEEFLGNVLIPAVKMRGGHTYGYDERLCANIVCNRLALEAADKASSALAALLPGNKLSPELVDQILPCLQLLTQLLNERIAEMRRKVWW